MTAKKTMTKKVKQSFDAEIMGILCSHGMIIEDCTELLDQIREVFHFYKIPKQKVEGWAIIVDDYFRFYRSINGVDPSFPVTDAKALKELTLLLKRRFCSKGGDETKWSVSVAIYRLNEYYNLAINLPYVKQKFCASYIYNNFDKIISELSTISKAQKKTEESYW